MSTPDKSALIRIRDTTFLPAEPSQDIRGRKVVDAQGHDVGDVHDLFIDAEEKKVRLLEISTGGFLGIGSTKFLIPVDAISRVDKWTIHINYDRAHVATSPKYDPKLIDYSYMNQLYQHYGAMPFWTDGYTYPAFPFYP